MIWVLTAGLLLAAGGAPLQACEDGTAVLDPEKNPGLVADCKVLLAVRDELAGDGSLDWDARLDVTAWEGVRVSGSPSRVSGLFLSRKQLTGTIPAALGQLSQLQQLSLGNNQLTGYIPVELGQLTELRELSLSNNRLWGAIPVELGQLSKLEELSLTTNRLSGRIPSELGRLSRLEVLFLSNNRLSGAIPVGLGQLLQLRSLSLGFNRLSGGVPAELGQLTELVWLQLQNNQLGGRIPAELGQLTRLQGLFLKLSGLTGEIPAELGRLTRLQELSLEYNRLTGAIPVELGQLTQLTSLFLQGNQLTGAIPAELGQLRRLQELSLEYNRLTGAIPVELGQLTGLGQLSLADNQLTGPIPGELGQLTGLAWLFLSGNRLTGPIPEELGQLTGLLRLSLADNQLTGSIPAELGQLTGLWILSLGGNQLTGPIPAELGQLTGLLRLSLADNQLTGSIPAELGQLTGLWILSLGGNQLTEPIPAELGQLTKLRQLFLAGNQLTGRVPAELGQLTLLTSLSLSGNRLTGPIPEELGQMTDLEALFLDNNRLTGEIPAELGQLTQLVWLHLQHNQLTGPIPGELGRLSNLRQFSFRGNQLTGPVPSELSHLPDVYILNLTLTRLGPDRITLAWDDPGDPTVIYSYRLLEGAGTWTAWMAIGHPEMTLKRREGLRIEWTLPGLSANASHRSIELRVSNGQGESTARASLTQDRLVGFIDFGPAVPEAEPDQVIFTPVILSSAGLNQSYFTSEMTLTNRGDEPVAIDYTYRAHSGGGGGTGTASEPLGPGQQLIAPDAIEHLKSLGIRVPGIGNRIGTLRVEVLGSSEVGVLVRTTTAVPEGRAGLAYLGVAEEEGFTEAVYLCGLRQNSRDRSNVAFQNMGAEEEGAITVRTTVYSGEAADTTARVLDDVTLEPGGFHQYSGLLGVLESVGGDRQGYVKVERVEGEAPYYAYGVINDQVNSDGSFIFPVEASSLEGRMGQTLPVIVETSEFKSELTVTNFSEEPRTLDFRFVAEGIETGDKTAAFSMTLGAGQQHILADVVDELRRQGVAGLGSGSRALAGAVFATAAEGDMSGIVIGARTGSQGGGGQYSVFYNAVPEGAAFTEVAWVDGLQQNQENRSNLALVNTGEVDGSASVFHLEIYDGETGLLAETVVTKPVPARRWHQINGILRRSGPETRQGYIRIEKMSGENPFLAYGVVNDGGAPGERSGDGAYLPARE